MPRWWTGGLEKCQGGLDTRPVALATHRPCQGYLGLLGEPVLWSHWEGGPRKWQSWIERQRVEKTKSHGQGS